MNFKKTAGALDKLGLPEERTFIIGVDINSFPVAYMSEGNYWGFDVELAQAVCDKLGWTLQIQPIEKENVYIELYSGNIDCAWGGIALDEEELAAGRYTQYGPYMENDIVVASSSATWASVTGRPSLCSARARATHRRRQVWMRISAENRCSMN